MRISSAAQSLLPLALIAGSCVGEGTKRRMTVRKYKTNYRIDWWDDGRDEAFRVKFSKFGLKSAYFFDEHGYLQRLAVDDEEYTFTSNTGSRMLHASEEDESKQKVYSDQSLYSPYTCTDCEKTWDKLCYVGLVQVCALNDFPPEAFDDNALDSVRRMCTSFGAACETSAPETCDGQCLEASTPTPAPPSPIPLAPTSPAPTPDDACQANPCQNGGSCNIDPAGGHVCSCAPGYGGLSCQTDTSNLAPFYIEIDYIGTWTDARKAVFQAAAARWSEVITHVPCGGAPGYPAGRLLIESRLDKIDGVGGTLGRAGPMSYWGDACPTISATGQMTFDVDDIIQMEKVGTFEGVIMHEMGHVIGIGTFWGTGYGECTTCLETNDPAWTCPAAAATYRDMGGSDNNIVELDGSGGTACSHLDEVIFQDELMTGYANDIMYMSKMTASVLDDLKYVVDVSAMDAYTLPSKRESLPRGGFGPSVALNDTLVGTTILVLDSEGNVVDEVAGLGVEF